MDEVYALLVTEKSKIQEQKDQLEKILKNKCDDLKLYQTDLKSIQESLSQMKKEVRRAVENEVKSVINKKYSNRDMVYDYPLQMSRSSKS